MKRIWRYAPYAFIVWFAKRKLERFNHFDGITCTTPFNGEIIAWLNKENPHA